MSDPATGGPSAPQPQWDAADYHRHSSEQQKWARELITKLALRPDEHVLDVGCGDGKVTAEIAAAVPDGEVVGIDISEEMIRFARSQFPTGDRTNLSFEVMDAGDLQFGPRFNVVFSSAVLHWVADHRPVLAGIARSLKPGGRILLQMGGRGNAATILDAVNDLITQPRWRGYFAGFACPYHFYGPERYGDWLRDVGLEPVRVELIPKDMTQKMPEGLAGWVRTTWMPYTRPLPEELRAEFIADVVDACAARHPPDAQGNAHLPMVRLEVEAIKGR